jgi:hypothetical protein
MLAAVFLMQSVGQLLAYGLGWAILEIVLKASGLNPKEANFDVAAPIIDVFWRVVIAIGVFPALTAIWLRRKLPETPLWLVSTGQIDEGSRALGRVYPHRRSIIKATARQQEQMERQQHTTQSNEEAHHQPQRLSPRIPRDVSPLQRPSSVQHPPSPQAGPSGPHPPHSPPSPGHAFHRAGPPPDDYSDDDAADDDDDVESEAEPSLWQQITGYFTDMSAYLRINDRFRTLLGVCIVWFLVDIAFYSLGLDSPRTIQQIWRNAPAETIDTTLCKNRWQTDPGLSIYETLRVDIIRNLVTISTGAVTGSVLALFAIDYVPRVSWMACWFVALASVFAVMGGSFFAAYQSDKYALTITLYVLTQ